LNLPAAAVVLLLLVGAARSQEPSGRAGEWDGSRTTPVHRLVLVDEAGDAIVPSAPGAPPYSARQTCGSCHDYAAVAGGFHFSPETPAARLGRPAQPWFWVDPASGTQVPVSGHGWPQTWTPAALGLTPWQCTTLWGRHFPGGGWGDPVDELADPGARWEVSGKVEIHCQACHGASPRQDPSEWAKQIGRENFRWAATAADGFGEVGGMASRVRESWRLIDGPNPDDHQYAVPPYVRYDLGQFDPKHRVLVDLSYRPPDRNCLFCHSVAPVKTERWQVDGDVHTRAGLQCVDCHRNGADHQPIRGYEGEAAVGQARGSAEFSCRGCHLGTGQAGAGTAGRLGAPRPRHRGLPPSHFETLSCTACHSGFWPENVPRRVRTARANRLGIHGRAQWYTDAPQIVEPVFMKTLDGRIAPHRMAWPAFWARIEAGKATPLRPEALATAGKGILDAGHQVSGILAALGRVAETSEATVLVLGNSLYEPTADGRLQARPAPAGTRGGGWWAWLGPGGLTPLVPDFDPAVELDSALAARLLGTLQALSQWPDAPGQPLLLAGRKRYAASHGALEVTPLETAPKLSGWAWQRGAEIVPLLPEFVLAAVAATTGREEAFNEDQVARVLQVLAAAEKVPGVSYGYVSSGKLFRLAASGGLSLEAVTDPAAEPCALAVAHDVRPARRALGSGGCTDCHSPTAALLFGTVPAAGPLLTSRSAVTHMYDWHGLQVPFNRLFAWTFYLRPWFKAALGVAVAASGLIVLAFVLPGVRRAAGFFSHRG
jgi:hypothetical protein